ncbi:Heat shock protein DnaJ [Apiospora sp. TS-2023a]
MAPPKKKEPTLWEILALSPQSLQGQDPPTASKSVKQAYRRALLKYHPDKNPQAAAAAAKDGSTAKAPSPPQTALYTVDQITHAYTVLSDAKQRREYTRNLQTRTTTSTSTSTSTSTRTSSTTTSSRNNTSTQSHTHHEFKTGVETVDLDDLSWDGKRGMYYRSCRCGQKRGFRFREDDLEESGEDGELMVECTGCSLSLKVLFEEVTDDEDDEDDDIEEVPQPQQRSSKGTRDVKANSTSGMERTVSQGSHEGKSGKWGWKFSFGISVGGGVGLGLGGGRS